MKLRLGLHHWGCYLYLLFLEALLCKCGLLKEIELINFLRTHNFFVENLATFFSKECIENNGATEQVIGRERETATLFPSQLACVSRHVNAAVRGLCLGSGECGSQIRL